MQASHPWAPLGAQILCYLEFIQDRRGRGSKDNFAKIEIQDSFLYQTYFSPIKHFIYEAFQFIHSAEVSWMAKIRFKIERGG